MSVLLQAGEIFLQMFALHKNLFKLLQKKGIILPEGFGDSIVHPSAFSFGGDNLCLFECIEVARDEALPDRECIDNVANTERGLF